MIIVFECRGVLSYTLCVSVIVITRSIFKVYGTDGIRTGQLATRVPSLVVNKESYDPTFDGGGGRGGVWTLPIRCFNVWCVLLLQRMTLSHFK